ncbi:8-amino-7-oxononanoate synthase [Thiomicrospira microaerophila]|uniref:8-amino-7-oxononanoate synthase n=1 Tax=Thiomicrospira microaerophila TaxID=406020 RepID=UPI00200DCFE8|nr:8-amino-7-oxononanoate synthase [Thiomicrospira microaerophila]UQB42076.1 8-amino-7-oxononanoate synthase [Thiomicrospira microaerophila]
MKSSIASRFQARLDERRAQSLYRQRPLALSAQQPIMQINGFPTINFCSNDYLGLASEPRIKAAVCADVTAGWGAGAAHLVTGHHLHHHLLEDELADWLGVERCLLFSTGYMANLAVQQTLMQKGDLILADKLNHASLIDGALASGADFKRYPHLDYTALARRLQASEQTTLVVSDSVFSMDGDLADINQLSGLANQHQAWLFIDDAHSLGVLGEQGRGSFSHFNQKIEVDHILVGTFGKAFGTSGAFVAGSNVLIESLIQFARPYIYTTASSPLNALATREALKWVKQADHLRQQLFANIRFFRHEAALLGLELLNSASPIQPILLGDAVKAIHWSEVLKQKGFWVAPIRYPTVPKQQARLRVTLSAAHNQTQIESLLSVLADLQKADRENG